MKKLLLAALAALSVCTSAVAQYQVPLNSVPLGLGGSKQGFGNAVPGALGNIFSSNGSGPPSFRTPASLGMWLPMRAGGTANDTAAVQADLNACGALGGCVLTCSPGATYTTDTVKPLSNTYLMGQGCRFKQRVAGTGLLPKNLFEVEGVSNVHFDGMQLVGTATPGGGLPSGVSGNSAIKVFGNSDRVWVTNSDIREFLYFALEIKTATNVWLTNTYMRENVAFASCQDGHGINWSSNTIDRTALFSLTPTADQFTIGFKLDYTGPDYDGFSYAPCTDVVIANNFIKGLPYSQGVLVHSGTRVSITGNNINGSSIGVSVNPFNLTDIIANISITGNNIEGTNASTLPTDSDAGIIVLAGGATVNIKDVTVSGNTVHGANRVYRDPLIGCYVFGFVDRLTATGNLGNGCGGNGIVVAGTTEGHVITGNTIAGIVPITSAFCGGASCQNGVLYRTEPPVIGTAAPRGLLMGNMVTGLNGATGTGYYVSGSVANLKLKDGGGVSLNYTYDTTTPNVP